MISFFQSARTHDFPAIPAHLALQDVGELFLERFEAGGEAVDVVAQTVVGESTAGIAAKRPMAVATRPRQCPGDRGQRRLADVGEARKACMMPQTVPNKTDVRRRNRADRGEEGDGIEFVEFALVVARMARCEPETMSCRRGLLAAQLVYLRKPDSRSMLPALWRASLTRTIVKRVEIAAGPEIALELLGLDALVLDREILAEDVVPGHERDAGKQ